MNIEPLTLTDLRVENFRKLPNQNLSFVPGINHIVGGHNSGKSSLLDLFNFFRRVGIGHTFILRKGFQSWLQEPNQVLLRSNLNFKTRLGHSIQWQMEHHANTGNLHREAVHFDSNLSIRNFYADPDSISWENQSSKRHGHSPSSEFIRMETSNHVQNEAFLTWVKALKNWCAGITHFVPKAGYIPMDSLLGTTAFERLGKNLETRSLANHHQLSLQLQNYFPHLRKIEIHPVENSANKDQNPVVRVTDKQNRVEELHAAGHGLTFILAIEAAIQATKQGSILLLDEPFEMHDPPTRRKLLKRLQQLRNIQVLVVSKSHHRRLLPINRTWQFHKDPKQIPIQITRP